MELVRLSEQKAHDHLRSLIDKPKMVKVLDQVYKKLLSSKFSSYLFVVIFDEDEYEESRYGKKYLKYTLNRIDYKNLPRFIDDNKLDYEIERYRFNIIYQIKASRRGIEILHYVDSKKGQHSHEITNEDFLKHEIRKSKIENILKEIEDGL